jgi:hypothetical protein
VALTDSPVAQLAWIAEKLEAWSGPEAKRGGTVDRDLLLTTVSLYWFSRGGVGAARFLSEVAHADIDWIAPSSVPVGWAVFDAEPIVRRFMDPDHTIAYWADHPEGGHFPAVEVPGLLVDDLRAFFRPLR